MQNTDVAIVGGGPSGAIASALLVKEGFEVTVIEEKQFPRFSIGESLLPQCMEIIEEAGMLVAVESEGFQFKNGAAFWRKHQSTFFNFTEKFTAGHGTTFQVQRARFDQLLADEADKAGADIRYQHRVTDIEFNEGAILTITDNNGDAYQLQSRFLLDASGFGRVLPRLLNLEVPSDFPVRMSMFTHVQDEISDTSFDRNKILISVHPEFPDVWYWTIPFSGGRCSQGVVAEKAFFDRFNETSVETLQQIVFECPNLKALLGNARFDTPAQSITGYSANVSTLWGENFALLGNAGEFLDPVFSSGVTIAMKSASLAVKSLVRQLNGESVDWEGDYAQPLKKGVDTFRTFVNAWYDGRFQDVIFAPGQNEKVRSMISSILAGYAWDVENPFVVQPERRLNTLVELCRGAEVL